MSIRASVIAVAAILMVSVAGSAQQPADVVPLHVTSRALDLRVNYDQGSLSGSETLRIRNTSKRSTLTVPLLLNRLMVISRITDGSGAAVPFQQSVVLFRDDSVLQVNAISVRLRKPLAAGDSAELAIQYGGHLVGYAETGSLYIKDKVDSAFTIIREDAFAFPVVGVPSRKINRATGYEPFMFDARVTVPSGFVVATGGAPDAPLKRDSLVIWRYRSITPAPALNIAIAPYRTIAENGVRIFYFPQDSTGAEMVKRSVTGALAQYAEWFGPVGGKASVTVIEIPEDWGSQASLSGGIIQTADAFRDRAQLYQVYHELSHLWNVNEIDKPSPRWNEGLASFLQWRMAEKLDGWTGWDARLDRLESNLVRNCAGDAPCTRIPLADYGRAELTDYSYSVGMAMFYALFKTLGTESFDKAYRGYYQQHRAAGGTSAELVAAFHDVDPRSDRIFADWFSTTKWHSRLAKGEKLRDVVQGY
jgi:hypothetical protein